MKFSGTPSVYDINDILDSVCDDLIWHLYVGLNQDIKISTASMPTRLRRKGEHVSLSRFTCTLCFKNCQIFTADLGQED